MQTQDTLDYLISQGFSETILERFWSKVNKDGSIPEHCPELGQCWLWTDVGDHKGYGYIGRGARGSGRMAAHRMSWAIHYGDIPNDLCVLHRCDNPPCVRPEHLFLGTHLDNIADMIAKKRNDFFGIPIKLTEELVLEILAIGRTVPVAHTAKRYGVARHTINGILDGKLWKKVKRLENNPALPWPAVKHGCRLTAEQVAEIWKLRGTMPHWKIAELYKVSEPTIEAIFYKRTWRHILSEPSFPPSAPRN